VCGCVAGDHLCGLSVSKRAFAGGAQAHVGYMWLPQGLPSGVPEVSTDAGYVRAEYLSRRKGLEMQKVSRGIGLILLAVGIVLGGGTAAQADNQKVTFEITDEPGAWFRIAGAPINGLQSLAIATPGTEVVFTGKSNTVHTRTSLLWPTGATNMPFDTEPRKGSDSLVLHTPGLYVFTCKIHPYMFGAVIIDGNGLDDGTLELGKTLTLVNTTAPASISPLSGFTLQTYSDLAVRLLRTFFIATGPQRWIDYSSPAQWDPFKDLPDINVTVYNGDVPVTAPLKFALNNLVKLSPLPADKAALVPPGTPAVGEIWVDTQFEKTSGKNKPGTATAISGQTWQPTRKVALPQINMNNPHNMWTDKNQNLIYQTQWFDSKLTVFNRTTGKVLNNITVGESPAHVMTQVGSDKLHVTLNGAADTKSVVELSANAGGILRKIDIGEGNPHAHWMSHDGNVMVTPNPFTHDSTVYNFPNNGGKLVGTNVLPIAVGMTPDSTTAYVANLLDSTITVIDVNSQQKTATIDLLKAGTNYDPIGGIITLPDGVTPKGPVGALPIQTPVAPDGKSMVTANTLSGTITIVNPATNEVVKMLPCDPGCHGVQYGAKQGGGYYAYVSSKFSNALIVVDPAPNGDPAQAAIVGRILLTSAEGTVSDDTVTGNPGMGGQGILPIPVVYNGWVQQLPQAWKDQLTTKQQNPLQ